MATGQGEALFQLVQTIFDGQEPQETVFSGDPEEDHGAGKLVLLGDLVTMEYLIWGTAEEESSCRLVDLAGFEEDEDLFKGISLSDRWPDDVTFKFDPDFPYGVVLQDHIYNTDSIPVVSKEMVEFLGPICDRSVEALPLTLLNHKGRRVLGEYYILNPIGLVDCLDLKESKVTWSSIDPNLIDSLEKLVLNVQSAASWGAVFRPRYLSDIILVRDDVARAMDGRGLTGSAWISPADYLTQ